MTGSLPRKLVVGTVWVLRIAAWALFIFRGVLYPAAGADDLQDSWGGPTLAGAWAVHVLLSLVILSAVTLLARRVRAAPPNPHPGHRHHHPHRQHHRRDPQQGRRHHRRPTGPRQTHHHEHLEPRPEPA